MGGAVNRRRRQVEHVHTHHFADAVVHELEGKPVGHHADVGGAVAQRV